MAAAPKIPDLFAAAMAEAGPVFDGATLKRDAEVRTKTTIAEIFKAWATLVAEIVDESPSRPVVVQIPELARRSGVGQAVLRGSYGATRNFARYFAYYLATYNNCPAKSHGEFEITIDVDKAADPGVLF